MTMTYAYVRFSTDKQDEIQQVHNLAEYARIKGITIDAFEKDEGISGGVSYKDRNLYHLVQKLSVGDCLIVSEISRLGRNMSDLNRLINDELKPRKVRLIVSSMGLDLDCTSINAINEMILFALSFGAQLEKELLQGRTKSAMDDRKERIIKDGGFFSEKGRWCTHLGRKKGTKAPDGSAMGSVRERRRKAEEWKNASPLCKACIEEFKVGTKQKDILKKMLNLYDSLPTIYCTRTGKKPSKGFISALYKEWQMPM